MLCREANGDASRRVDIQSNAAASAVGCGLGIVGCVSYIHVYMGLRVWDLRALEFLN